MSKVKTTPTAKKVDTFIAEIKDQKQQQQCEKLVMLFEQITVSPATMWGASIIGFGSYHYKYASGREGDWMVTGFAPRKNSFSIYIMPGFKDYENFLNKLGPHKIGKSCLTIKKLENIDFQVLGELIKASVKDMEEIYDCRF